jgi:multidrug resistance efflux pump
MSRVALLSALPFLMLVIAPEVVPAEVVGELAATHRKVVAAAPGRIEGSGDAVLIGASISGIVEKVTVQQGDLVSAGQLLVRIVCSDVEAQLAARIADHEAAAAFYRKLINGPRPEEIDIAEAELNLAGARLAEAQLRTTRSATLADKNAGSQATRETDSRDARMAAAQVEAARLRLRLLKAGTREEELAEAKAKTLAAQRSIDVTKAELSKCEVTSPLDGLVLRKHVSEGELISLFFPKPLITLSKIRKYRVRAEVDEHDVWRVKKGQNVEIVLNVSNQNRFRGRVTSIAPVMGRRQILTSDPADKSDRDVMEVFVEFENTPENLPIGLRVSIIFLE